MGLHIARHHNTDPTIADLVRIEGTVVSTWPMALLHDGTTRDLADAAHVLCTMYGAHPGLIDAAADRDDGAALHDWLLRAANAFAEERAHLAAVIAAAGPLPSTPGQARTESAIAGQRRALDMLAQSDRAGCAVGAAIALALDWRLVRPVIDAVAARTGLTIGRCVLPVDAPVASVDPATARARLFGARQLLGQQRGLWSLLEARSIARAAG